MTEASLIHALSIIVTLVILESLLSADNALVMAILVRPLPKHQQKPALMYGIVGAFVFRFLMLIFAIWVIKLWYLRAAGGAYLGYLTWEHFWHRRRGKKHEFVPPKAAGFWKTVLVVNLVDCAFAIDSVLVAVGLSDNIWIVFIGVALGIVAVRIAAGGFIRILERWPGLEDVAYLLIGWISLKLFIESYGMFIGDTEIEMPPVIFWIGMGAVAFGGAAYAIWHQKKASLEEAPAENSTKEVV